MEIEWAKELPPHAKRSGRPPNPVFTEFAAELRRNRGKWAKWPVAYKTVNGANSVAYNVRNSLDAAPAAFRSGRWDTKIRQGHIYVRYLGK